MPASAANVTVSGTVDFSALDGSVDDADHTVNGVFTVSGDLVINGTILCIDDSGRTSACPMSFNVGHDLIINAGGAIYAENRTGTGTGAPITFTVGHDFVMHGPTTTLAGAIVSTDSSSSSGSNGGNITANVSAAVTIDSGATIDSGSANAVAGNIAVTAGGHIDASGNVLAGPSRTILSTRLTGAALSGGTGNQVGGAVTLKSTSFIQPGITIGSNANIVSQGQTVSAGPVTIEGCGVVVDGLVASLAQTDASSRVVIRSGKSIDVDARDLGVTGATLGRNGKIRGDAPTGTAINHVIDLFAFNDINVLGPDPAASSLAAISGSPGVHDSKSDGATIRIISLTGSVTGSGNVLVDGHTASGDDGGNITVSSAGNINFDHAVLTSIGDSNTSNPARGGGTITLRSYSGNVVWTSGTGDVRPVGSSSGLPTAAQGAISITACGTINLAGSTFPTNGPPVGVFPGQITSACTPAAPSLPVGEPALPVCCNVITITNPSATDGTAGTPFSQTFTQTGAIGTPTFSLASGTLPSGLTLAANGTLSGTPVVVGTFPLVVQLADSQGCTGIGTTYNLHIGCQTITVTNPAVSTGVAAAAFSQTFTQSGAIGGATFSTSSTLPSGLSLSSGGVLSGTPTQTGTFPIVVTVTDGNGCSGSGAAYNLTITCQTITVTNPATASGTANSAFSATFTQSGGIGATTFSTASALPAGLTLSSAGVLSGTPTQTGTFPIVVTATDANGCHGSGATYNLVIACQTITVTNPAANSGTVNTPFSATFTASNTIGATTFTTASALPAGLALSSAGVLSGTPTQTGTFSIVVTATDGNGCSGGGATYTLTIACQVITVVNPSSASGTAGAAFSAAFTATNAVGATTFTTASALPAGLALAASGVLSGTPTQTGTFPIVVSVTDANGCSGTGGIYSLVIHCQTITVTNPANNSGVAGSPFSATFTQSGAIGGATFSTSSTLPAGLALSSGGVLSGTPTQTGSFSIVVTVTDGNGCTGTGATYTLTIACQTITVTNPVTNLGTAGSPFSALFTQSGAIGGATFSTASLLPSGLALAPNGALAGTPVVVGTFPIVVTVTDGNGCTGSGATYNLVIGCQTITVTNPSNATGTVAAAFSEQFTQSGAIGGATFTTASTLPAGLTLSASGVLSGTPTQTGTFPIVVTVTDGNGCTGTSATYNLVINCQTITVTNPTNSSGTVGVAFSEQFTQSGAFGTATFSTSSALPAGLTLSSSGLLSGTPMQSGTFSIVVRATDANGCFGDGAAYLLVIACNVITVTNPANSSGTAGLAFSETFTQSGANGAVTWSESGALPSGITLNASTGVLSGTTTQTGSFPITVTATDANGCSGSSSYTLTIACQTITVTNPVVSSGTAGVAFSATFTATGILGTATWSETGALPSGITLSTSGVLSGTTTQTGSFPIVVKVTDSNGCFATSSYTLTINCQTVTVTNPANNSGTAGVAFSATFTATGILGTATWSESGALPAGITLNASTGVLSGTPTQTGSFPITVTATDSNGCSGSGATYTLTIVCPTITVTRTGGGTFPAATFGIGYPAGNSFTATGQSGTIHWSFAPGGQPPGINLTIVAGTLSGIPTATGTFTMTVVATDQSTGCTGQASFTFTINPQAVNDSYTRLINNTQAAVTGGAIASPATPFVPLAGTIISNDLPSGGVTVTTVGTFATTQGGSVQIAADGTFLYTPPVTFIPLSTDSFNYTVSSNTGAGSTGPTFASGSVTLSLVNRVWYINPNAGFSGNGQSQSPWNNTNAITGTNTGDILFVYDNGGSTANTSKGITLLANQTLWGQGVTLVVNAVTLVAGSAGQAPTLTGTSPSSDVVVVNNGNLIQGVILTNSAHSMIAGSPAGLTVQNATLRPTGTANGMTLTSASSAVTVSNVTMSGSSSGDMINVSGGTATWSVTGSPISQTAGRAINVSGTTGGGMTFDAASTLTVSAGTADGAMQFRSNSGTFTFNGAVALTVSGTVRGLLASTGGTVAITDATSTISASGGAAIDFQNSTIGGGGLNFRSVSANGGINGIVLNNTGSLGGLTVAGNGGTCTSLVSTCTGGTIQSSTGHGISLTATQSPSFNFMKITNIVNSGINGTGVTNFTLSNSVVDGVNNGHTATDGNVAFNLNSGSATENNLSGVVSITNNVLNNSYVDGINILNYAGTISSLTITGNSLTSSASAANSLGSAILVTANRGAGAAQIGGGSISGNTITNFPGGAGIQVIGGNSAAGPAVGIGASASPLLMQDNSITGAGPGAAGLGTNGITTTIGHQSSGYFTIGASGHPNTITNVRGDGIACGLFGSGTEKCVIAFNTIVANNTAGSLGINTGADQATSSSNAGTLYLDIHDNNVSQTTGNGILATVRSVSSTGIFHIERNVVARPTTASGTIYGIRVDSGNGLGSASVCLRIAGNTTTGSTNGTTTAPGIGLRVQHTGTTSTMQIDGLTPTPANDAQMQAYVGNTGQNPGTANGTFGANGVASISAGATFTASTCTIP